MVIAIIAILAAILFPVFAKAREKARQSSCLSNVKQIALAVMSYAQDYDEMMPISCGYTSITTVLQDDAWPNDWWQEVAPYVKNTQIFACPSASTKYVSSGGVSSTAYVINYGYNIFASGASLGTCTRPSETGLNVDGVNNYWRLYDSPTSSATNYLWSTRIHNDGFNASFVDGHAKWISGSAFTGTTSPAVAGSLRGQW